MSKQISSLNISYAAVYACKLCKAARKEKFALTCTSSNSIRTDIAYLRVKLEIVWVQDHGMH